MKVSSQGLRPACAADSPLPGRPLLPARRRRRSLLAAAALWAVLAAAAPWAAAQAPAPGTPALIAMTMETDRADYFPGEPVVVTCHLVNWQSPLLILQGAFSLQSEATDLRIYRNGGEMSDTYRGSYHESPMTRESITTRYAKAFEFRLIVCYDPTRRSRMALDKPDEVFFGLHQEFLISNPNIDIAKEDGVQIEGQSETVAVVEPTGDDAAALKLLRTNPHCFEDIGRQSATPGTAWIFRKIATDYPKTRYTPYCLLALAHQCLALGENLPDEAEQGRAYLRQLVDGYPDFALRLDAQASLADAMIAAGRPDVSRKMVSDLIRKSPDNLTRLRMHACAGPFLGPSPNPYLRANMDCWDLFDTTQLVDAYEQRNPADKK